MSFFDWSNQIAWAPGAWLPGAWLAGAWSDGTWLAADAGGGGGGDANALTLDGMTLQLDGQNLTLGA